jgi:hypothetical protein
LRGGGVFSAPEMKALLLGVLAAAFTGCVSAGTLQPATTLGTGHGQFAVEMSYQGLATKDSFQSYPMVGVTARIGLNERVDLGARLGPAGAELQVKAQLNSKDSRTVVSVGPHAGVVIADTGGLAMRGYSAGLPLLIGVRLRDEHQLVIAPQLYDALYYGSAGSISTSLNFLYGGLSVGVAYKTRTGWITPEIGFLYPLAISTSNVGGLSGTTWGARTWTLQANLGVLIGG